MNGVVAQVTSQETLPVQRGGINAERRPSLEHINAMARGNSNQDTLNEVREYVMSLNQTRGSDFGLAIAYFASNNSRIKNVTFNSETNKVSIKHQQRLRLLGVLPVNAQATSIVSEDGEITTRLPWWNVLSTRNNNEDLLELVSKGRNPQTGKAIQIAAKN